MICQRKSRLFNQIIGVMVAVVMILPLLFISAGAEGGLSVSASKANITVGKTVAIIVTSVDKSVTMSVSDRSIVTAKWDSAWSGNTIKILLTGVKKGKALLTVTSKSGETAKVDLTVSSPQNEKITYGTSSKLISATSYDVSVNASSKSAVTVTSKSKELSYKVGDKSIATVSSGKWSSGKIKFTITGIKAGTTYLSVYRKNDKSIVANIKITVKGIDATDTTVENANTTSVADEVLALVNAEREKAGVKPLVLDETLCDIAVLRSKEIADEFSHTRPNGTAYYTALDDKGIKDVWSGENIAAGQSAAKDVMDNWMSSQGHKENILNPNFTKLGLACYKTSGGYKYYWVQIFTS